MPNQMHPEVNMAKPGKPALEKPHYKYFVWYLDDEHYNIEDDFHYIGRDEF